MNVVVLQGHLSRPPERRELPSGDVLVGFDVTVPRVEGRAESVPVVWFDAPASSAELDVGTDVVAVGRVRRRFFRAGGATQSRTEVVAEAVVAAPETDRASRLLREALSRVEDAAMAPSPWPSTARG